MSDRMQPRTFRVVHRDNEHDAAAYRLEQAEALLREAGFVREWTPYGVGVTGVLS